MGHAEERLRKRAQKVEQRMEKDREEMKVLQRGAEIACKTICSLSNRGDGDNLSKNATSTHFRRYLRVR